MRIGKRDVKRRLTGLTLPVVGGSVTWSTDEGERIRARSALHFLEDRRVLYSPYEVEVPESCVESVREIREHLRGAIQACQSAELRDPLRAIQAAAREFLTTVESLRGHQSLQSRMHRDGAPSWLFNQGLGELRARVGVSVALIIDRFDIEIDEHLVPILPPVPDEAEADPS